MGYNLMPKMKQVTVNGHTYNTIRDAWRAESPEGLKEVTVRARLNDGWIEEHAFLIPPVEANLRRRFKGLRLFAEDPA